MAVVARHPARSVIGLGTLWFSMIALSVPPVDSDEMIALGAQSGLQR
jgi:hypothetical protein